MEKKIGQCPLGAKCEEVKEDIMYVCPWYIMIRGKDPQSEDEIDEYRCAMGWLPMLLIENAQMSRQTGAAVESFRNEMTSQNNSIGSLLIDSLNVKTLADGS